MSIINRFFKNIDKRQAVSWAFFDFANSSYSLLIISFVFPIYFKEVIAGTSKGDFYWGLITSLSILAAALAAPIIGAIADYDARKKGKFILFASISMLGTASFYFTGSDKLLLASILFIITNFFFDLAVILYDSFLAQVSSKETSGRISGLGWGLGYLGGIVAMLLLKPLYSSGYMGALDARYRLTFPLIALFFLLFALPAFLFLKENKSLQRREPLLRLAKIGFQNTITTIKNIRQHKEIALFLLGFYFINDALVTLFAFIPIYAKTTLFMTIPEITIILLLIQVIGFPSAVLFGLISDKKGHKKILLSTLGVWCLIVILTALATSKSIFYFIAVLAGLVIGSSQAVARSWLSKLIPDEKRAQFFGFNGFATKISATTGPVIFGSLSVIFNSQRIAMFSLLPPFLLALFIFSRIHEAPETPAQTP